MCSKLARTFLIAAACTAVGCTAGTTGDAEDEPSTLQTAEGLSTFGKSLVGDYRTDALYPRFSLDKTGAYSWDTGIRCITTPCPSGDAGYYHLHHGSHGRHYVHLVSSDYAVSRWFLVAALEPAKLVGIFGTTGTFTQMNAPAGCSCNAECAKGEQCIASTCTARPLCVQVNGDGRFTARDFAAGSYPEANAWGESTSAGSSWGIGLATCAEVAANLACADVYAPVCALTNEWNTGRTFSNECEMRRAVIGQTNGYESTAIFQNDACTTGDPRCSTYWLRSEPTAPYPGAYYVKTFDFCSLGSGCTGRSGR